MKDRLYKVSKRGIPTMIAQFIDKGDNKEVADYISEQAKARSMSRSRFVEWLVDWMTSEDK